MITNHPPGIHLLIDLRDAAHLSDQPRIEHALREAAIACGATILGLHLHGFGDGHGVTGVAVLAESHISIHTWPELGYAAVDVFLCGACDPLKAVPIFEAAFETRAHTRSFIRG